MLGDELKVMFHYEGKLQPDMTPPLYKGGKKKMRSIPSDITFESLVKVAINASHWEVNCEDISIQYLHHNGKVSSLVDIEDDNDIKCILTLTRVETDMINLYINRTPVGSGLGIREQPRSHGLNMHILRDGKCAGTTGSHDAKRKEEPSYPQPGLRPRPEEWDGNRTAQAYSQRGGGGNNPQVQRGGDSMGSSSGATNNINDQGNSGNNQTQGVNGSSTTTNDFRNQGNRANKQIQGVTAGTINITSITTETVPISKFRV